MAEAEEIINANKYKKELQRDDEEDEELVQEFLKTEDVVGFVTLVSWIERVPILCVIFLHRFPICLQFAADFLIATNLIFAVFFIGRFIDPSAIVNNWLCNREESEDQESDTEFSDDDEEEAKSNIEEEEEENHYGIDFLRDKKCLRGLKLEMRCRKLDEENYMLSLKLHEATEALNEHLVKWDEEKKDLAAKLDESIETLRHCQQEKKDLAAKLDECIETLRNYEHFVNDNHFKDQRRWEKETDTIWYQLDASNSYPPQNVANAAAAAAANSSSQYNPPSTDAAANWEQERNDLTAKVTATNAWYQHYLHAAYDYQLQNHNLLVQRNDLSVRLQSANTSAEFYKACMDDSDGECRKLREEINNLAAKLFAETLSAEHYHKLVDEMEEKCRKFQEEKNELVTKLCAAKASSQLYRSYLHDVGSLGV